MSSIENALERETAEASAEQEGLDIDAASDNDASKAQILESVTKDISEGFHHARSDSIKKPITFKAVSVTKHFLAKASTTSTPTSKGNGDKSLFDSKLN